MFEPEPPTMNIISVVRPTIEELCIIDARLRRAGPATTLRRAATQDSKDKPQRPLTFWTKDRVSSGISANVDLVARLSFVSMWLINLRCCSSSSALAAPRGQRFFPDYLCGATELVLRLPLHPRRHAWAPAGGPPVALYELLRELV